MSHDTPHNSVAPLRNVAALVALIDRIQSRAPNLDGMGTFYGPSGFGKSTAAIYATNKFHAVTVQVKSVWTNKKLCQAILAELAVPPAKTIGDMLDQISAHLAMTDRPLIIDEADHLVRRNMIEIVRDIYEGSQAPVILIGEELLPQKLKAWERVHGRMLDWVPAQPGELGDVGHLARIYAPDIEITPALRKKLLEGSMHSIRRICVNLDRLREFAKIEGLRTVDVDHWGQRGFDSGAAPEIRKFAEPMRRAI